MLGFLRFWDTFEGFEEEKCPEYWDFRDFGTLSKALRKKSVPNTGISVILGHFRRL